MLAAQRPLQIQFLDVGQGDAALIRSPAGKTILIDAGPNPNAVAAYLKSARVDTIDLVIASHNHADHIGGMPAVLASIPVRNYMDNGMAATTRTYMRIVTLLEQKHIPVLRATRRRIDLGDGVVLRVLGSAPNPRTQNDASIGIELSYGSFRALFTGDGETRQRTFWATDSLRPVSVLKVSHHGSSNGTDSTFLGALHPCVAVVSVGAVNSFKHPSAAVLRLLKRQSVTTYRTDQAGRVTVIADSTGGFAVSSGSRSGSSQFNRTCAPITP